MTKLYQALASIFMRVLEPQLSLEEVDGLIACCDEILLDREEISDLEKDLAPHESLLSRVVATACSGTSLDDTLLERLSLELEAAGVLDLVAQQAQQRAVPPTIEVGDVCPVFLAEAGFEPAKVIAIDIVDAEAIVTLKLVHFNRVVKEPLLELSGFADDEDDLATGVCELCDRQVPLTRHHLIPRTTHRKYAKICTKEQLNTVAMLCRPCHSAVHRSFDNFTLAESLRTIEALQKQASIQRWVTYAKSLRKQSRQEHGLQRSEEKQRKY
eukprot:m.28348 g.28348  ORF g.28348 m.28348 type:complete len:270 (-) comp11829_c0_seq4:46-855(-)